MSTPSRSAKISVIIVNLNGDALLDDCLGSLCAQTFREFEVIFVDNGSTDESIAHARRLRPDATVVSLDHNAGFARANNIGFAQAAAEWVLVLNNDASLEPSCLSELLRVAESDPAIGMVAPKILNHYDRHVIDSVGGLLVCPDGIGLGRGRGEVDRRQYDEIVDIIAPSGCAALYRREMIERLGGFCEAFFAYCEDLDFALRAQWTGWRAVSAPSALVFHKYSATSGRYSALKLYLVERNHFLVAARTFPIRALLWVPLWSVVRYALMIYVVLARKGKGNAATGGNGPKLFTALIRGLFAALLCLPQAIVQRPRNPRRRGFEVVQLLRRHRAGVMALLKSG